MSDIYLYLFFLQIGGASPLRVCYQRGLPRLVLKPEQELYDYVSAVAECTVRVHGKISVKCLSAVIFVKCFRMLPLSYQMSFRVSKCCATAQKCSNLNFFLCTFLFRNYVFSHVRTFFLILDHSAGNYRTFFFAKFLAQAFQPEVLPAKENLYLFLRSCT